jgi:hypothetical protein
MLTGHITDISPGTQDERIKLRFPNGVPAVSDESQSQWMMYVYKQFERPINATGVQVSLSVIDANGNFRSIGTTKADSNGFFSFAWTPDISGDYAVTAIFAGSESYYPSSAEDHSNAAPAATPTATNAPGQSMTDQYFIPAVAAIIAVIIIVGAILGILLVRKKP